MKIETSVGSDFYVSYHVNFTFHIVFFLKQYITAFYCNMRN